MTSSIWEHEHAADEQAYEHAGPNTLTGWRHVEDAPRRPLPSRRTSRVSKRVRKRRRSLVFLIILVMFAAVVYFAVQAVRPMLGGFDGCRLPRPRNRHSADRGA